MQKNLWLIFKLNYNFVRDVLKKIEIDLNLLQENLQVLDDSDWRRYEKITRDQDEEDEDKKKMTEWKQEID